MHGDDEAGHVKLAQVLSIDQNPDLAQSWRGELGFHKDIAGSGAGKLAGRRPHGFREQLQKLLDICRAHRREVFLWHRLGVVGHIGAGLRLHERRVGGLGLKWSRRGQVCKPWERSRGLCKGRGRQLAQLGVAYETHGKTEAKLGEKPQIVLIGKLPYLTQNWRRKPRLFKSGSGLLARDDSGVFRVQCSEKLRIKLLFVGGETDLKLRRCWVSRWFTKVMGLVFIQWLLEVLVLVCRAPFVAQCTYSVIHSCLSPGNRQSWSALNYKSPPCTRPLHPVLNLISFFFTTTSNHEQRQRRNERWPWRPNRTAAVPAGTPRHSVGNGDVHAVMRGRYCLPVGECQNSIFQCSDISREQKPGGQGGRDLGSAQRGVFHHQTLRGNPG